jgi:UDP-glucose 4-epimerase
MLDGYLMFSKYRKICVTGGAGFIGSHLVDRLVNEGYEVLVIDNLITGKLENIKHNLGKKSFHFVKGDIRDYEQVRRLIKDVDAIFHQAALTSIKMSLQRPTLIKSINVTGTLKLLEATLNSNVKRFIYASSAAVYGDIPPPQKEDMCPQPISPYGESKLAAENYIKEFHEKYGLETICLRYFNVYGSRQNKHSQYSSVITKFIERLLNNKPLYIYGDGQQTRDFISVKDVVRANMLALESGGVAGEIFNVGTGVSISINELAKMIVDLIKRDVKIIHIKPKRGDVRNSLADITKVKKILRFYPKHSLKEELPQLVEWHRKNKE